MSSLHAQYILEREGKHTFEDERGFATYVFLPKVVYVEDVFVLKEFRATGVASYYVDEISKIAKANGYSEIITTVSPKANGATTSMKAILSYGFELDSSDSHAIYFKKTLV